MSKLKIKFQITTLFLCVTLMAVSCISSNQEGVEKIDDPLLQKRLVDNQIKLSDSQADKLNAITELAKKYGWEDSNTILTQDQINGLIEVPLEKHELTFKVFQLQKEYDEKITLLNKIWWSKIDSVETDEVKKELIEELGLKQNELNSELQDKIKELNLSTNVGQK